MYIKNLHLKWMRINRAGEREVCDPDSATICRIIIGGPTPFSKEYTRSSDIEAEFPEEMNVLIRILHIQYDAGQADRSAEIRKLLGVKS